MVESSQMSSRKLLAVGLILSLWSSWAFNSNPPISQRAIFSPRQQHSNTPLHFSLDVSSNSENDEQAFISSVLYDGTFQGIDDGLLAYLPEGGKNMPPRTKRLLCRITSQYVYGIEGQSNLSPRGIAEVLESEYDALSVSMIVGDKTFTDALVVQIVSLAVLYQLPSEILLKIVQCAALEHPTLKEFQTEFQAVGWDKVRFPAGLGLRLKKGIISRTSKPSDQLFFPPSRLPWKSTSSSRAALAAQKGIELAAQSKAPEQTIRTKEEFLVEIENEIQFAPVAAVTEPVGVDGSFGTLSLPDTLPSFPSERYSLAWMRIKRAIMNPSPPAWSKLSKVMDTQYKKLKGAGRAGLMAYAFLNFAIYTIGMTWQWRRIQLDAPLGATLVSLTLKKFVIAFGRVYVGAAVFKLARIGVSLALAPAAGRVLRFTQRKLRVSENAALVILMTLLVKTFLGTLAVVCLGDTALRKALQA